MDHRGIEKIRDFLRRESHNRIVENRDWSFLQCIGGLVQANASLVEEYIRTLLNNYSSRLKVALALMHNKTPVQKNQERDEEYKKRLDTYYEKIISALATYDGKKYTNVYLYAVATVLQASVYVLMEDENRRLSWFYFPPLFDVNAEEVLPSVSGRTYLTLFMDRSMSACLPITSRDEEAGPPQATGYIGMQNASLTAEPAESIVVPDGILKQREGLLTRPIAFAGLIDGELIGGCSDILLRKGIITQETSDRFCSSLFENSDRQEFVEVLQTEAAFEIFCKFIIRNKRWNILCLLLDDFEEDLAIREDSPELEASFITLPLDVDELRRSLDMTKLRPWLGVLREKWKFQIPEGNDEQIVEKFVDSLLKSKALFRQFCMILLTRREHALLECLGLSEIFRSAGTCEYLSKYVALKELERAIVNRAQYVDRLKQACLDNSSEIEERRGRVNWAVIGGSTTGVVGGVLAIVGLALTPVTAGLSLGLTIAGAAVGAASGAVSGGARGYEAYKQIGSVKDIKAIQNEISELEINIQEHLRVVESLFTRTRERPTERAEEGPSADLRGFLAFGSALRSAHGFVALGIAAARVGTTAAAVAASVLGPLSLVVDIGFLVEAGYNKKKGNKVTTAEQLRETAVVVEMKSRIMKSIWRGNFDDDQFIVH